MECKNDRRSQVGREKASIWELETGNSEREPTVTLRYHCSQLLEKHHVASPGGSELSSPWSPHVPDRPHPGLPHKVVSSLKTRTKSYLKHSEPQLKSVELIVAPPHWCSDADTFWGSSKSYHVTFKCPSRQVCQLLGQLRGKSQKNEPEAPDW